MLTFLHNFSEKKEKKRKKESVGWLPGIVAGTVFSQGPGSSPASELTIHENLSKLLSLPEFQVYHL